MDNKKTNTKFFGLGAATIDFRIRTAEMGTGYTEKLLAQKVDLLPGGSVANCLAKISALGGQSCWLGKLGNDWIGSCIIEQLQNDGIDVSAVIHDAKLCSPFNLAAYAGEKRRRVGGWLLPNSLSSIDEEDIEKWAQIVFPGDWLIVEIGEVSLEIVKVICVRFSKLGVKIAIDVDLDPVLQCGASLETIDVIFKLADILIPNQNSMSSIYGQLSALELAQLMNKNYDALTVVTAGDQGAWACNGIETIHQVALPVKVVDTVGAGDAFHGALIWALAKGITLAQALELAGKHGAEACTIKGAR